MKYFLICTLFLFSCSSSRKIKTELHTVSKIDSVSTKHFDSAHVIKESVNDTREITIEYDSSGKDTVLYGIAGIVGLNLPTKGLRRINIRHSNSTAKYDSAKVDNETFTETHSEIKEDKKETVEKKESLKLPSLNIYLWKIGAVILGLGVIWIVAAIRKRKKKINYK